MKKILSKSQLRIIPNSNTMDRLEIAKSKAHIIVEIIEYIPNSVVIKSIIKKTTGNINLMAFDTGEGITKRTLPYDTFAQIIDGKAEIIIDGISHCIKSGQSIIIPAHLTNTFNAKERFKMMLTSIKPSQSRKRKL